MVPSAAVLTLLVYLVASFLIRLRPQRSDLFVEYLSTLTRKRLPLEEGLHAYAVDQPFMLRRAIFRAVDRLKEGGSLADALDGQSKYFPQRLVELIRVGQESGMLPELLDSYVKQNRSSETNTAKIIGIGVYPGSVLLLLIPILSVIMVKIVPQFQAMFSEMDLDLPPVTMALITVYSVVSSHSWLALFVPVFIEAMLILFLGFDPPAMNEKGVSVFLGLSLLGLAGIDALNQMPQPSFWLFMFLFFYLYVFIQVSRALLWEVTSVGHPPEPRFVYQMLSGIAGRGPRLRSVAAFCETFATLLESGLATATALPMACRAAVAGRNDNAMQRVENAVSEGEELAEAINRELALSGTSSWVLSAANNSRHFPRALHQVGERCIEDCEKRLRQMCNIVIPLFVLLVAGMIGFVTIALFSPLIHLTSRLAG